MSNTTSNTDSPFNSIAIVDPVHYVTASQRKQLIGLQYPLSTISEGGYFSKAYNLDLMKNNIRQLILTEKGERVMQPEFGVRLRSKLFEPLDTITLTEIRQDIVMALNTYLPIVSIVSLEVTEDISHGAIDLNRVKIKLVYTLKQFPFDSQTINLIVE